MGRCSGASPQSYHQQAPGVAKKRKSCRPAIEIAGAAPCSGKTQLLYLITAVCLLPKNDDSKQASNGKGGAVVWIDTDNRFDVLRLHTILRNLFQKYRSEFADLTDDMDEYDPNNLAKLCLQHVHVFRPQSTPSLIETIKGLPDYLFSPTLHYSSALSLQTIVIGNLSSFLWQDRQDADAASTLDPTTPPRAHNVFFQRSRDLVEALRNVQLIFDCTVVAGNWALSPIQFTLAGPSLRSHVPPVWNSFWGLRLVVMRDRVMKFRHGMGVEEALTEAGARRKAVRENGFICWVNRWGSKDWESAVEESLRSVRDGGRKFEFRVSGTGIEMANEDDLNPDKF